MKSFSEHTQVLREEKNQEQLDEILGPLGGFAARNWSKLPKPWKTATEVTGMTLGATIAISVTAAINELIKLPRVAAREMNELIEWSGKNPGKATAILIAAGATVIAAQQAVAELRERRSTRKMVKILTAAGANSAVGKTIDGDKIIEVTPEHEREAEQALLAAD